MSVDLDRLLGDTGGPDAFVDVDDLWQRGRRRRRGRFAVTASVTALVLVAGGVGVANLVTGIGGPADPLGVAPAPTAAEDTTPEPDASAEEPVVDEPEVPEVEAPEVDVPDTDPELPPAGDDAPVVVEEEEGTLDGDGNPVWEPDPAKVAAPCAGHEARTDESFIEVVSPVAAQDTGDTVDLVGCANVHEATVLYQFRVENGPVVGDTGFVTATCGTGCVGEFRETLTLPDGFERGSLEVFWEDMENGSARSMQTIPINR